VPAIYMERQLKLRTARDQFYQKLHFKSTEEIESYSTLTNTSDRSRTIAAAGTFAIDLGGMTAVKTIYIETSAALQVTIGAAVWTVAPVETNKSGILYVEGSFASITLTNPDAANSIEVLWMLAGT